MPEEDPRVGVVAGATVGTATVGLAGLFAMLADGPPCPVCPPIPPPPGYDIAIAVPASGYAPDVRIELEVRPGIVNAPSGGRCTMLAGRAVAPDGTPSDPPDPSIANPPENCEPVPEPTFGLGLALGLLILAIFTRRKPRGQADL